MKDIMDMMQAGRLHDATAAIQDRLSSRPPASAPDRPTRPDRPMKDVTPRARPLPGPTSGASTPRPTHARARASRGDGAAPGRWTTEAFGRLPAKLYTPTAPSIDAPLVVMLHGCTQTPDDFAAGTRMNHAAEALGAHVLWPEQTRAANPNGCWSWFDPAHQGRGGEAGAIAAAARAVRDRTGARGGVHVAGLSAGGAMAAILGAHHADLVASVGVHSGLAVGSAQDVGSAFAAMRSGGAGRAAVRVPAIVFHGTADRTVAPANARQLIGAGRDAPPRARRRNGETGGRRHGVTHLPATGSAGPVEFWEVEGLAHAWSGGDAAGSYADPKGPNATAEMMRFFRENGPK